MLDAAGLYMLIALTAANPVQSPTWKKYLS